MADQYQEIEFAICDDINEIAISVSNRAYYRGCGPTEYIDLNRLELSYALWDEKGWAAGGGAYIMAQELTEIVEGIISVLNHSRQHFEYQSSIEAVLKLSLTYDACSDSFDFAFSMWDEWRRQVYVTVSKSGLTAAEMREYLLPLQQMREMYPVYPDDVNEEYRMVEAELRRCDGKTELGYTFSQRVFEMLEANDAQFQAAMNTAYRLLKEINSMNQDELEEKEEEILAQWNAAWSS